MKNWKSFIAFFLFIVVYGYTVFKGENPDTIWNTGLIALVAFLAIMSRSDIGAKLFEVVADLIKKKMS